MKNRCVIGLFLTVFMLLLSGCGQKEKELNVNTDTNSTSKQDTQDVPIESVDNQQEKPRSVFDYVFDLSDKKSVSQSSGTGGTEWRGFSGYEDYSQYFIDYTEPSHITGVKYNSRIRAAGLDNKELMDKINEFLANAENSVITEMAEQARNCPEEGIEIDENIYQDGSFLTFYVSACCHDGYQDLNSTYNIDTGKQVKLSDLFYDGFNYIDYINTQLSGKLGRWDDEQKMAFTGIANDYPYFYLEPEHDFEDILFIYFPRYNPFFHDSYTISITLTDKISPYGTSDVIAKYKERWLTDGVMFLQPVVGNLADKSLENKINAQICDWVNGLLNDKTVIEQAKAFKGYTKIINGLVLEPFIGEYKDYLSISYCYSDYFDGAWMANPPLLSAITFNKRTGEIIKIDGIQLTGIDWSKAELYYKANVFELIQKGEDGDREKPTMNYPAENAVILNAYLHYNLILEIMQPDGTMLTAYIPHDQTEKVLGSDGD